MIGIRFLDPALSALHRYLERNSAFSATSVIFYSLRAISAVLFYPIAVREDPTTRLSAVPPCRETGGASLVLSSGSTSFGGSTHASPETRTHGTVPSRPRRVLRFARGPHSVL